MRDALSEYGMLVVLLLLCALFSVLTLRTYSPVGPDAADQVAEGIDDSMPPEVGVLIVAGTSRDAYAFTDRVAKQLSARRIRVLNVINGDPRAAKQAMDRLTRAGERIDVIAATGEASKWLVFSGMEDKLVVPGDYRWPAFFTRNNLLNVASQISIIAIIAIGMTMVIITAGIDLSVGSLIALSAVVTTLVIQELGGGLDASVGMMIAASIAGIVCCALIGGVSGAMVTLFEIPAFIVTLAMMLMASGAASLLTSGESVYQIPPSFTWLGRETSLFGLPNSVTLMLLLYALAHLVMTRTIFGRYLYAVGGNPEASRLSGVPLRKVILSAYVVSGMLAGVGGVVMASQLKSGSPTYGVMYELYVIAAVVVGGTSLAGGKGNVFGTLIGALIIAVIQNGMNLLKIESFTQKVVLGAVILGAVLVDRLKSRGR